jgi:hypothetical protein
MARMLTRSAPAPPKIQTVPCKVADFVGWKSLMGILLVIMFITVGLALRAASVNRRASLAGSETGDVTGVVDAYARTSLLVLLCLLGLFSLGLVYGNVLGGIAGHSGVT